MCMFHGKPEKYDIPKVIKRARKAWKVFKTRGRKLSFLYQSSRKLTLNTWMKAQGQSVLYSTLYSQPISNYGFHVFFTEKEAKSYADYRDGHEVLPVLVKGRVFGVNKKGMRTEMLRVNYNG